MVVTKVKDYILNHGIKIGFIAKSIGMNENTLSQKLNGKSKMTVEEFVSICRVMNVSSALFTD